MLDDDDSTWRLLSQIVRFGDLVTGAGGIISISFAVAFRAVSR